LDCEGLIKKDLAHKGKLETLIEMSESLTGKGHFVEKDPDLDGRLL